jgi:hypothetical protein
VEASSGWLLFYLLWSGPENVVKAALRERFGSACCSKWAHRKRKPDGDARVELEQLAGIAIPAWSRSLEGVQ